MNSLAVLTIACGGASLFCLLLLHFVSPEFKPSWRMISEYALGKHKWLITAFFLLWGACSLLLAVLLWDKVSGIWAKAGLILLLISAVGEIMGGLFDVKHKWHGMAFGLGVPTLPVAALLVSYNLPGRGDCHSVLLYSAHATWVSLLLMSVAMASLMSGFKKAGMQMTRDTPPPEKLPEGMTAWAGYANRLLVLCYVGWLIVAALCFPVY